MSALKIKKGDTVKVIAGKDVDKEGKVLAVNTKDNTVLVEGVNMVTKHTKQAYINASNVMYLHNGKPARIGFTTVGDKKVRTAKVKGAEREVIY